MAKHKHKYSIKHKYRNKDRIKRKKSSSSDSDAVSTPVKHVRLDTDEQDSTCAVSVSDVISEANSVLYEADSEASILEPSIMASGGEPVNKMDELCATVNTVLNTVCDIKKSQDTMKSMFEKKLDDIRKEMLSKIDTKIKSLQTEISTSICREKSRIDKVLETMQSVQTRLTSLEERSQTTTLSTAEPARATEERTSQEFLNDPDCCITASGLPVTDGENLLQKATDVIDALGGNVSASVHITGVTRMKNYSDNRPPLVKISFQNVNEKILVLRNKMKLKDDSQFKNVYLKSSKSHAERLIELNARALLRHLPQNNRQNLRVDASGRIREQQQNQRRTRIH